MANIGIEHLDGFAWPVTDQDYFSLMRDFFDVFEKALLKLDPWFRGILLADFSYITFLAQASHAEAVRARVRDIGAHLEVGPLARQFYNPDWQAQGTFASLNGGKGRITDKLKGLAKDLKFNNFGSLLRGCVGNGPKALGIGSFSGLKGEYARKRGLFVRNAYIQNLVPPGRLSGEAPRALTGVAEDILERINGAFSHRFGFDLFLSDAAFTCWKERLGTLFMLHEAIRRRKGSSLEVLVTETASPLHKVVAAAFKTSGGRSVGFHHGNSMGGQVTEMDAYTELSSYDIFVCPTRGCADAFAETYENCNISRHLPVDIVSTESMRYQRLQKSMAGSNLPESIRSVMLMGFPMNANRYFGLPGYFFFYQIFLELELIRTLLSMGYRVLYKVHPERINRVLDLVRSLSDQIRIIKEPFEKCWHLADAFLFKQTATTTFGFALCTNRPIMLLDTEKSFWKKRHYELLERRCRLVPSSMDEIGIHFDRDVLSKKLAQKPEPPNNDYLFELMYPTISNSA